MLLFIVLYLVSVPITWKVARCKHDRILRQSHFLLAVVCRAENNRYYLRRGIELRPGYLARWIEFNVIRLEEGQDLVEILRSRHINQTDEIKKNVEIDHQRYLDGVNRNVNEEAIKLRIQIEEAKLVRPLTDEEKL